MVKPEQSKTQVRKTTVPLWLLPRETPQIAISVYARILRPWGYLGSTYCTGLLIEKYLTGEVSDDHRLDRILEFDLE